MTAEIGQFALILAMMIAAAQTVLPLIGAARQDPNLMGFGQVAAVLQLGLVGLAFGLLAHAFATSDFSLLVVASNSNTSMPLHFRISATWGNHEGSLLLWILILALFGAGVAVTSRAISATLRARVLAIQALIAVAFLALTIFTSNPFERLDSAPHDGMELNPLLQDIGLVLHPPFLYLGYVGFSTVFSFAVAALIEGRLDAVWARLVRPWVLLAWIFLTIGITLGSYWAYYELGWGGWWFWDPVENASFMPWLVGTALLHSVIVVERRHTLIVWTLLLAILTFSLSLVGTFLVRSGIITSVHAFVTDPTRGLWILTILVLLTGGALTLFAARAREFNQTVVFAPLSREGGLILNNILLVVATGTVFLGTFYPLIVEMLGPDKISVGPPYYERSFVPLMIPLMLALSVGPFLRWKRDAAAATLTRMRWIVALSLGLTVVLVILFGVSRIATALALGVSAWLVLGALGLLATRVQLFRGNISRTLELLRNTPRATYGMVMAHMGLGLMVAGITAVTSWQEERIAAVAIGETVTAGGYEFRLDSVDLVPGPNYRAERGTLTVLRDGQPVTILHAERREFPVSGNVTTEAAITPQGLTNLYVSMGGPAGQGRWVVRVYYHPFVLLIWLGPTAMSLGGLLSLSDRRVRVGAPRARPATPAAVPQT